VLLAVATTAGVSLYLKNPLKMDVIRDRGALARESAPGVMENVYRIQIMNTDEKPRSFRLSVEGLPGIRIAELPQPIEVGAAATRLLPLRLQVPADAAAPGPHKIEIVIESVDDAKIGRREKSTFILPRP
jgi:polyferredoxin